MTDRQAEAIEHAAILGLCCHITHTTDTSSTFAAPRLPSRWPVFTVGLLLGALLMSAWAGLR